MPPEIISIIVRWTLVATIVVKAPAIKRVRINRGVLLFRWKANWWRSPLKETPAFEWSPLGKKRRLIIVFWGFVSSSVVAYWIASRSGTWIITMEVVWIERFTNHSAREVSSDLLSTSNTGYWIVIKALFAPVVLIRVIVRLKLNSTKRFSARFVDTKLPHPKYLY